MFLQRRLIGEKKMLDKNKENYYQVIQDDKNDLVFYFLFRCCDETSCYNGGYYIGKIEIPPDYPMKPGDFYMLTPSGRFEINKKICLTNSGYHSSEWRPIWNLQNMVIGMISIFMDDSTHGISHIKQSSEERRLFAMQSIDYNLVNHYDIFVKFDRFVTESGEIRPNEEINLLSKNQSVVKTQQILVETKNEMTADISNITQKSNNALDTTAKNDNVNICFSRNSYDDHKKWIDGIKDISIYTFDIKYFMKYI